MADKSQWGDGHAGRMFRRGWDELRSAVASYFQGSNLVQPDYQYAPAEGREKSAFAQAVEQSRQVPGAEFQNQQERPHGREPSPERDR